MSGDDAKRVERRKDVERFLAIVIDAMPSCSWAKPWLQ